MQPTITAAPMRPPHHDPLDEERGNRQARRWALLNECFGNNDEDVRLWIQAHLGEIANALGPPDISANPLVDAAAQYCRPGLYGLGAPRLRRGDAADTAEMERLLGGPEDGGCGYWTRMQYVQRQVFGVGDWILRFDAIPAGEGEAGRLVVRNAWPWDVAIRVEFEQPSRVLVIRERRLRRRRPEDPADLSVEWLWDELSIEPGRLYYRVVDSRGEPQSNRHLVLADGTPAPPEGLVGDAYPYRYDDGTPYLPYQWYATEDTGDVWHDEGRRGATHGALNTIVRATWTGKAFHSATAAPVIVIGAAPPGEENTGSSTGSPVRSVPLLPGSALFLGKIPGYDGQPVIFQSNGGGQLSTMDQVLGSYERRQLARLGVAGDDVLSAANPESAQSRMLSRTAKREAADAMRPFFAASDARAVGVLAALARLGGLGKPPERGWRVEYPALPRSPEERAAEREDDAWDLEHGLTSRVRLYRRRHPGASDAEAVRALRAIEAEEALLEPDEPDEEAKSPDNAKPKTSMNDQNTNNEDDNG